MDRSSKYTAAMKVALSRVKAPYKDVHYAVVEYPNMLTIRVFENNIMQFSVDQRVNVLEYLELLRKTIASFGVTCELEGVAGDAPRRV
jgi:hypothetical protein